MAQFEVVDRFDGNESDSQYIWDPLRQHLIEGRTVELVDRTIDGKPIVEARMWDGVRGDDSNLISATPGQDY